MARDHINDARGYKKWRHLRRPAIRDNVMTGFYRHDTTNSGTDCDANSVAILIGDFKTGILHRLNTRDKTKLDKTIHSARVLLGDVVVHVEIRHRAAKPDREVRSIERLDGPYAAVTSNQPGPRQVHSGAQRGQHPHTRDYNSTIVQAHLLG